MLRHQAGIIAGLIIILAPASFPAEASAGTTKCKHKSEFESTCTIELTPPAGPVLAPTNAISGGGGAPKCMNFPNIVVPCSDPVLGFWLNSLEIYCKPASPPPDPGDPAWGGHYGAGAVYDCVALNGNFHSGQLWLPATRATTISPQEAAQAVVRRMDLRAADIGIVPQDKPGSIGAVGAPVFMWTTPGPTTFGPQVLTASQGGVSITATAKVDRIVWDMGDGSSVTCRTPGTVYRDSFGFGDSPDCGYRYSRTSAGKPNNAYPIAATSFWVVNWTGPGGSAGQITLDLTARTNIVVGELQALVTN